MKFNYDDVVGLLKESLVEVVFTKQDGSERVMTCTLMDEYLPEKKAVKALKEEVKEHTYITVWDFEKKDWRSFRVAAIKSVSPIKSKDKTA